MNTLEHYLFLAVYPLTMMLFLFGAFTLYRKTGNSATMAMMIGFGLALAGFFIKNYGMQGLAQQTHNNTFLDYQFLLKIGVYMGLLGLLVAAVNFIKYARSNQVIK